MGVQKVKTGAEQAGNAMTSGKLCEGGMRSSATRKAPTSSGVGVKFHLKGFSRRGMLRLGAPGEELQQGRNAARYGRVLLLASDVNSALRVSLSTYLIFPI